MKMKTNYESYGKYFSPEEMMNKVTKHAKKAGIKLVYGVMLLYYTSIDSNTPAADKAKIFGAIGYFILPLDLIPDMIPVVGYTDDMAAIVWALKAVWDNITPDIHSKARASLEGWFGKINDSDLELF